jgi:hypothetical protein
MTKDEKAGIIRECYDRMIEAANRHREQYEAGIRDWKIWDAIIAELQVARERAVRKALK